MRLTITLLFSLHAAVAAAHAQAPSETLLVLPLDPQAEVLADRLRPGLTKAGINAVLPSELARKLPPPVDVVAPSAAAALASAMMGAIRRFYFSTDPAGATATIEKAVDEALAILPRLHDRGSLWDATRRSLAMLAMIALQAKDEGKARAACKRFAVREPNWDPPGRDFSPPVRRLCAEERAKILATKRAPLKLDAAPGVLLFVDGLPVGRGAQSLEVSVGEHDVQGLEDGFLSRPRSTPVSEQGGALTLSPYCEAPVHLREPRCRAFAVDRARASGVLELGTTRTTVRLRLWRGDALKRDVLAPLALRMAPQWLSELAAYGVAQRQTPPELPKENGPPVYKRWWFWTALGVVAAGGLGAALLVPRPSSQMEFTIVTPPR